MAETRAWKMQRLAGVQPQRDLVVIQEIMKCRASACLAAFWGVTAGIWRERLPREDGEADRGRDSGEGFGGGRIGASIRD